MNIIAFKLETINTNIDARLQEIAGYEINLFNYEHMLNNGKITDPEFLSSLQEGIQSNLRELNKVKFVLEALQAQKQELERIQSGDFI